VIGLTQIFAFRPIRQIWIALIFPTADLELFHQTLIDWMGMEMELVANGSYAKMWILVMGC
jgi:hypothetical protein